MSEQSRILSQLRAAGALGAVRWAFESAAARTAADYDEVTGHNELWIGVSRYVLLCDRLDRVFSLGKYAIAPASDADAGIDIVTAGLSERDVATMPVVEPGVVIRSDVSGSPGWVCGGIRWLLSSMQIGEIDTIDWSRKSPVKQRAASQPDPDSALETLLHQMDDAISAQLLKALEQSEMDIPTLVLAHAQDVDAEALDLYIGLPAVRSDDSGAWAWRESLMTGPPSSGGGRVPVSGEPNGPRDVPDAPVRLRPASQQSSANER